MKGDSLQKIVVIYLIPIVDYAAKRNQLPQHIRLGSYAKQSRHEFCSLCPVCHVQSWLHGKPSNLAVVQSSYIVEKP